ncbi:MAG: hypothetical protein K2X39_05755, partial [Silvanigrellaceae bacterium]|nr:hypothetical protein [Silvanigrellaceae bacterium]
MAISFIDFVFPQFAPLNWQNGISIYRAGGISYFQSFGELVSCRVKAGVGENYEVRLKLHSQGKCLQWMECTCQPNRRKGENCPHIAAFCLYLDQEKTSLLARMQLSSGASEAHLTTQNYKINQVITDEAEKQHNVSKAKTSKTYQNENLKFDMLLSSHYSQLISIDKDKEDPWLNVTVMLDNLKKITYRFGIDEACRLLFNTTYSEKVTKKAAKLVEHSYLAKRFFFIKKHDDKSIKIY